MATNISQSVIKVLDETESADNNRQICKLLCEIKRFQEKTKTFLEANYQMFQCSNYIRKSYLTEGDLLLQEAESTLQNVDDAQNEVLEINEGLQLYMDELKQEFLGLKVSCKAHRVDDLFQSLEDAKNNAEDLIAMDILAKLKDLIYDPDDKMFQQLSCYQIFKLNYLMEADTYLQNVKQSFDKLVQFTERPFQNNKMMVLRISKDENQLNETIQALFNAGFNPRKLCEYILTKCIEPIVKKKVYMAFQDDLDPDFMQLTLSHCAKDEEGSMHQCYKTVFKNLEMFVLCLGHLNIGLNDNLSVFNVFSDHLKERMLSLIVDDCLMNAVPATMEESNQSCLVQDVVKFNKFLVDMQLIDEKTDTDLMDFTEKLDVFCRNRFCSSVLDTAEDIIRKDLLESTLIAEQNTPKAVADNPFLFPCCMVSKTILEFIHLLERIIRQQLIAVIPSVIYRYTTEVPMYHEKIIQDVPQATAFFYNNTMFLAHWVTKNSDKGIATFATLVKNLHFIANEHFNQQIANQRRMLLKIIKNFDLCQETAELSIDSQKQIRDCLRQLELLRNNWQCILPDLLYNKATCGLLNDFCAEMIRKVMLLETIVPKVAEQMTQLLAGVEERAAKLFKDPKQVTNAKTFVKLSQLKMILSASLSQITEQWGQGKGPLTANYKSDEIKQLIRAVFENTDRRANALASIV